MSLSFSFFLFLSFLFSSQGLNPSLVECQPVPSLKWRLSLYQVAHLVLVDAEEEWGSNMEQALDIFNEIVPTAEGRDDRFFSRMTDVRVQVKLRL